MKSVYGEIRGYENSDRRTEGRKDGNWSKEKY